MAKFVAMGKIRYWWHPEAKQLPFCLVRLLYVLNRFQGKSYNIPTNFQENHDISKANFEREKPMMLKIFSSIIHLKRILNKHVDSLQIKWGQEPAHEELDELVDNLQNDEEDPITRMDIVILSKMEMIFLDLLKKWKASPLHSRPGMSEFFEQFTYVTENLNFPDIYYYI